MCPFIRAKHIAQRYIISWSLLQRPDHFGDQFYHQFLQEWTILSFLSSTDVYGRWWEILPATDHRTMLRVCLLASSVKTCILAFFPGELMAIGVGTMHVFSHRFWSSERARPEFFASSCVWTWYSWRPRVSRSTSSVSWRFESGDFLGLKSKTFAYD
jgi:hypothetical protein